MEWAEWERLVMVVDRSLMPAERRGGVAYLRCHPIAPGAAVGAGTSTISARTPSHLGFIDPVPLANWGHDCRYLVIDAQTLAVASQPARFPPSDLLDPGAWRLVHRAAGLPDTVVVIPHDSGGTCEQRR